MAITYGFFVSIGLLFIVVIVLLAFFYSRHRRAGAVGTTNSSPGAKNVAIGKVTPCTRQTRSFSFDEVRAATREFSHKIGEGRFGPVYFGELPDGQEVAVKVRSTNYAQGGESDGHLLTEVHVLAKVHHRHLVSLLGYCLDPTNQVLVYEFMRNGTLRNHLQRGCVGKQPLLNWRTRLVVIMDAARGLHSLHTDWNPVIIHRDFNSINVMLDESMNGKVADFGVSKITLDDDSGIPTLLKCTAGYLDPEYFTTQKLTPKSDVYSFGVVLFEIISGRPPISYSPDGNHWSSLVEWAKSSLKDGNVLSIVDPSLQGLYSEESVRKVADLAMCCVDLHGPKRPDMEKVLLALADALYVEENHQQHLLAATASLPVSNVSRNPAKPHSHSHQLVFGVPMTTAPSTVSSFSFPRS
ncbi:hypothetical protein MPTK1_4g23380 [Marchantia polymorpha subsp. ruderalis]|uniref:non-specific serine/threonine protein kinase n=2 Tax=Marchantia polymorpha TaxID=3197 RepID=A0A176VL43_MARPO|nr:hypothetical protein AXG93_939s1280 [Marchantia polymorpha subsp. ruderalis]PTQ44445.1 hypothetical protein MARPO_0020s0101 [Marchantia polymorpha]PTQ44446.1 hypothetical protein MARPO_0020s0101 [Marchantia polymorpha]BBN09868.1 hypothetical protein Mp_4g23380 [Marchantia polymorpha subsp. ruderalis]BBN09869.1 hypothetical protein Mp_4g23380 [Marchantia polymorpha subsp. ruderalis]|eukprot:PTQ44445.1 hypothetical protein MARPO_0020s0101 [Marchantia polymorpha]